ncbi:MAG: hypothetical protein AAGA96_18505 [Verrucomicrobiota bacterium]
MVVSTRVLISLMVLFSTQSYAKSTSTRFAADRLDADRFMFNIEVERKDEQFVFTVTIKSNHGAFSAGTMEFQSARSQKTRLTSASTSIR